MSRLAVLACILGVAGTAALTLWLWAREPGVENGHRTDDVLGEQPTSVLRAAPSLSADSATSQSEGNRRVAVSDDPMAADPAVRCCQQGLTRLFTPKGRQIVHEYTDARRTMGDKVLNPDGISLNDVEVAELQALLDPLDDDVEAIRFQESSEHWRALERTLRRGDYETFPNGKITGNVSRLADEYAARGERVTISEVPGKTRETQRQVVVKQSAEPLWFELRDRVLEGMNKRTDAIRSFYAARSPVKKGR